MNPFQMKPPLLAIADVKTRLNVSDDKVRQLLKAGKLRGARIDRQWRIDECDLEAYIERQKRKLDHPTREQAVAAAFDADDLLGLDPKDQRF